MAGVGAPAGSGTQASSYYNDLEQDPAYWRRLQAESAAGSGYGGVIQMPEEMQNKLNAGYEYDPVKRTWVRSPTSAGSRTNQYSSAAMGGMFPSLDGLSGSGSSGSSTGFAGIGGSGSGGPVTGGGTSPSIQAPDPTAATNAAFASAKDRAGNLTRASLDSLAGEMGAQGMLGSGGQMQGMADILTSGTNIMGEESRAQMGKQADISADFAKTKYAGDITQRGQDIAAQEANARLALAQQQQQYQLLNTILNSLGKASSSYDMQY